MYKEIQLRVKPEVAGVAEVLKKFVARSEGILPERIKHIEVVRRSVDARQKEVLFNLTVGIHIDCVEKREKVFLPAYRDVSGAEPVIVVGAGPGGLFAALRLIEKGFCPIILERGKAVDLRKKDLNSLYKTGVVNEDSNFGFGEGGAGNFFLTGKLYTRSKKKRRCQAGFGNSGISRRS